MKILKAAILALTIVAGGFLNTPGTAVQAAEGPVSQQKISFQGLVFGETPEQVKKKLTKFTLIPSTDQNLEFSGKLANEDVWLYAYFTPKSKRLYRVIAQFKKPSSYTLLKSSYDRYVEVLSEKYGQPSWSIHKFYPPYEEGDGYEDTAVRAGKVAMGTQWQLADGYVRCMIAERSLVLIGYVSAKYETEFERERSDAAKDDL